MDILGIYLSSTDLWLLAVAGGCLAWLVPHRLTLWREGSARRANASVKFRAAIVDALSGLYPVPTGWPKDALEIIQVLEKAFPKMQSAVAEFRPHVPWYKKRGFDQAWRTYRLGNDGREIDGQYYWEYVAHSGEGIHNGKRFKHDNTRTYKDDFKNNVDRILGYATST